MTDLNEIMYPPWTSKNQVAANAEGWDIFDCEGSENGRWQVCRIDDAEEWARANRCKVPQLKSDDDAWLIVIKGTQPHHEAARAFIKFHNIIEWQTLRQFAAQQGVTL